MACACFHDTSCDLVCEVNEERARAERLERERDEAMSEIDRLRTGLRERDVTQAELFRELNIRREQLVAAIEERDEARAAVLDARRALWLGHGCTAALYGDDGEMACNRCLIDFRRQSFEDIARRLGSRLFRDSYQSCGHHVSYLQDGGTECQGCKADSLMARLDAMTAEEAGRIAKTAWFAWDGGKKGPRTGWIAVGAALLAALKGEHNG